MSDATLDFPRRILIAEDDDSMRRFLEVSLKKHNFKVSVAKDGAEALEQVLGNDLDVIITDAIMPNLTGYDLCRILRETPNKKDIPTIILSGFDSEEKNAGAKLADFYLRKGENLMTELMNILSGLIEPSA